MFSCERRQFLYGIFSVCFPSAGNLMLHAQDQSKTEYEPFRIHDWKRDPRNPVLPPGGGDFDEKRCMNPFVVVQGNEYWLFYSGADKKGQQRICLATCSKDDVSKWKRLGPVLDNGPAGAFDELWCVLPCVHRIGDRWHLYYTGRKKGGEGLQSFTGIGLAVSDDLRNWKRLSDEPVLRGDGFSDWHGNKGIAGGGRIIELKQADGSTLYRMHYTLATGTPSRDLMVDQSKQSVIAHSKDGVTWSDKRIVLQPRKGAGYENAATIALNVWKTPTGWRAIYAGIGSKFGAYSICEASSADGLNWYRGKPGENLSMPPGKAVWENKMVEYPNVIREGSKLRLFYCGNGYGGTGIGTALAEALD
ncbi:MAG: hypothetical protein QM496_19205 [Verrucomicrobiota bacterium]